MSSCNGIGLAVVSLLAVAPDFPTGETLTQHVPGTDVSFTMAFAPAGTFAIGSPENEPGRDPDEGPQRAVTLVSFWIGVHVVACRPPPGTPGWRVDIPTVAGDSVGLQTVWLAQGAVATSGDTYRYVEVDGVRYSHIIDAATGLGVTERRIAIVFAPTAAGADALASAVTVLGPIRGIELVASWTQVSVRVLQADGPAWRQWQSREDRVDPSHVKHRN